MRLLEVAGAEDMQMATGHRALCPASVPGESRMTCKETGWGSGHRGELQRWPQGTTNTVPLRSDLMWILHGPSELKTRMLRRASPSFFYPFRHTSRLGE